MDFVKDGTCGACKYFEFAGNNKKGYCTYYRAYYWDDDSCRHYEEGNHVSSSSPCFLTTACCQFKGLPDDCYELTALRRFRDTYLMANEEGRSLVAEYYKIAPGIVEGIEARKDSDRILEMIYNSIHKIIEMIENEEYDHAIEAYTAMVYKVQDIVAVPD